MPIEVFIKGNYTPIKTCCVIILLPGLTLTLESQASQFPIYCECLECHRIAELKQHAMGLKACTY